MTITTIESTINAQLADLEEALQSNIKNNDTDRIKGCEFAIIELNILLNTFRTQEEGDPSPFVNKSWYAA